MPLLFVRVVGDGANNNTAYATCTCCTSHAQHVMYIYTVGTIVVQYESHMWFDYSNTNLHCNRMLASYCTVSVVVFYQIVNTDIQYLKSEYGTTVQYSNNPKQGSTKHSLLIGFDCLPPHP